MEAFIVESAAAAAPPAADQLNINGPEAQKYYTAAATNVTAMNTCAKVRRARGRNADPRSPTLTATEMSIDAHAKSSSTWLSPSGRTKLH